jgi:hypothetical protein
VAYPGDSSSTSSQRESSCYDINRSHFEKDIRFSKYAKRDSENDRILTSKSLEIHSGRVLKLDKLPTAHADCFVAEYECVLS